MGQVQDGLRQTGSLHDTAHLDGSFVFDELADGEEEVRRELLFEQIMLVSCVIGGGGGGGVGVGVVVRGKGGGGGRRERG